MKRIVCMLAVVALVGCAKQEKKEEIPEEKSTAQTAVEGATGKTAVDALKHARKKTDEAAAQRNADLDAALGE